MSHRPEQSDSDTDRRLLKQVRGVLAAAGGRTARSQVLLQDLARRNGLSSERLEDLVRAATSAADETPHPPTAPAADLVSSAPTRTAGGARTRGAVWFGGLAAACVLVAVGFAVRSWLPPIDRSTPAISETPPHSPPAAGSGRQPNSTDAQPPESGAAESLEIDSEPHTPSSQAAPQASPPPAADAGWWNSDATAAGLLDRWRLQWRRDHPEAADAEFPGPAPDESPLAYYRRLGGPNLEWSRLLADSSGLPWLATCLAREPDPTAAEALWQRVRAVLQLGRSADGPAWPSPEQLKAAEGVLHAPLLAMQDAAAATADPPWRPDLARILGTTRELQEFSLEQAQAQWWRELLRLAARRARNSESPPEAAWFAAVWNFAADRLPAGELQDARREFAAAVAARDDDAWRRHAGLIEEVIQTPDALAALQLTGLMEQSSSEAFREFLRPRLLRRAGLVDDGGSVAAAAASIRRALGAGPAPHPASPPTEPAAENWVAVRTLASRPPAEEELDRLQQLLDLAAGCIRVEAELSPRAAEQARLWMTPPTWQAPRTTPANPADAADPDPAAAPAIWHDVQYPAWPESSPIQRMRAIDETAEAVLAGRRVSQATARSLADLLLRDKSGREIHHQRRRYADLGQSMEIRLAVADRLEKAELAEGDLVELVERLMMRRAPASPHLSRREALHRRLLMSVVEMAPPHDQVRDLAAAYQFTGQALAECWRRLALLRGGPTSDAGPPSEGLRRLVEYEASRQGREAELRHSLTAVDFVASNDLQRTAFWQRLYLRERWPQSPPAAEVRERLRESDRTAASLLVQLIQGQQAWLQCLLREAEERADPSLKELPP